MEVLVVLWLAFAVSCAVIASNKGRSVIGWGLLGFLFGPFALIIVAVLSRDASRIEKAGFQAGQLRRCPECAETIRSEATKCRFCGSTVAPAPRRDIWGRQQS